MLTKKKPLSQTAPNETPTIFLCTCDLREQFVINNNNHYYIYYLRSRLYQNEGHQQEGRIATITKISSFICQM